MEDDDIIKSKILELIENMKDDKLNSMLNILYNAAGNSDKTNEEK